jgi:hypothetical protein
VREKVRGRKRERDEEQVLYNGKYLTEDGSHFAL